MKKKTIVFLFIIFFTGCAFATSMATRKQIELKIEKKIEHRSSSYDSPIRVFIEGSLLNIDTETPIGNMIISIINRNTREPIYSNQLEEPHSSFYIELSGQELNSQYIVMISIEGYIFIEGEFTLN